jgi:hypothetical protein
MAPWDGSSVLRLRSRFCCGATGGPGRPLSQKIEDEGRGRFGALAFGSSASTMIGCRRLARLIGASDRLGVLDRILPSDPRGSLIETTD